MSTSKRALAGAATVALGTLLIAGCNDASTAQSSTSTTPAPPAEASTSVTPMPLPTSPATASTPAPAPTPTAAAPITSTDKKITLTLPPTWQDNTRAVGSAVVLSAKTKEPLGTFHPVLMVTAGKDPGSGLTALIKATGEKKAKDIGGQFAAAPARTIGGVKAEGYQVTATQDGQKLVHQEYFVPKGGQLYIVTLSASADQLAPANAEFQKLLTGWAWA